MSNQSPVASVGVTVAARRDAATGASVQLADTNQCLCRLPALLPKRQFSAMDIAWSRWLFGAWAIVTALWLLVAVLMLVHTLPDVSVAPDRDMLFGTSKPAFVLGAVHVAPSESISKFLLLMLIPPVFFLAILWLGLRIAGLPFPTFRQGQRQVPKTG